jgi:hypothetical protein
MKNYMEEFSMAAKEFPDPKNGPQPIQAPQQEQPKADAETPKEEKHTAGGSGKRKKAEQVKAGDNQASDSQQEGTTDKSLKNSGEEDTHMRKHKERAPLSPRTWRRIRSFGILLLVLGIGFMVYLIWLQPKQVAVPDSVQSVDVSGKAVDQQSTAEPAAESTPEPATATATPLPLPDNASATAQNANQGTGEQYSDSESENTETSLKDAVDSATIVDKGHRFWDDPQFEKEFTTWTDDTDSQTLMFDEEDIIKIYQSEGAPIKASEKTPGKVAKAAQPKKLHNYIKGALEQGRGYFTDARVVRPTEKSLVVVLKEDIIRIMSTLRHRKEDNSWYFKKGGSDGNGGTKPTPAPTNPPVTNPPVTNPPVTNPPVTNPPVTNPPVTNPPVTNPPVTNPPVTNTPNPTHKPTATPEPTHKPNPTEDPNSTLPPKEPTLPPKEPTPTPPPVSTPTPTHKPIPTEVPTHKPIPTEEPTHVPVPTDEPNDLPSKTGSESTSVVTATFSATPTEEPVVNENGDISTGDDLPSKERTKTVVDESSDEEDTEEETTTTSGGHSGIPQD